jgi:hypothetical protein
MPKAKIECWESQRVSAPCKICKRRCGGSESDRVHIVGEDCLLFCQSHCPVCSQAKPVHNMAAQAQVGAR